MVSDFGSAVRALGGPLCVGVWLQMAAVAGAQEVAGTRSVVRGQPLSLEQRPLLTLGAAEGNPAQEFFRVRTPFLLPHGQVVVPLNAAAEIRVFTLEGHLVATHGRPGEGPGEFRDLLSAWPKGDTIEAFDRRLGRITRFCPDGTIETVRLDQQRAGVSLASAIPGAFGNGWVLMGITAFGYGRRDEVAVHRFSRSGAFVGVVARTEGIFRYEAPGMAGPAPLSPSASFSVMGDALYVGETLTPAIKVMPADGSPAREIAWQADPSPPRDALRMVLSLALQAADPGEKQRVRERLEAAPLPSRVPVFSAFLVDDLGFLWVRPYEVERDAYALGGPLYSQGAPGGEWWVYSAEGVRLGSIGLPHGLEPYQITTDAVVGIRRDEVGLEYVQVHRLGRR